MVRRYRGKRRYRRRRRRYSGSKYSYKRKRSSKAVMTVMRTPVFNSDVLRVKLKYSVRFALAGVVYEEQLFSGNSPYDPDYTAVGNPSAAGFVLYSQMYQRYRCRGSSFSMTFCNTNSTIPVIVGFYPYADTITQTMDIDDSMVQPYSKYSLMGIASGTSRSRALRMFMSTKKIYGIKEIDDSQVYEGETGPFPTGSDPDREWTWVLYVGSADGTSSPSVMGMVNITFYVDFFDRIPQLLH